MGEPTVYMDVGLFPGPRIGAVGGFGTGHPACTRFQWPCGGPDTPYDRSSFLRPTSDRFVRAASSRMGADHANAIRSASATRWEFQPYMSLACQSVAAQGSGKSR